jgi:hypothetical protein
MKMPEAKREQIIKMLDKSNLIYDPKAVIVLMTDGARLQGIAVDHETLNPTEKVDLVAYLLKKLEITLDDIEETTELASENRFMLNRITKGKIF